MRSSPAPVRPSLCPPRPLRRALGAVAAALFLLLLALPRACPAQVPVFEAPLGVDPAIRRDTHSDEIPRIAAGVAGVWVLVWQVVGAGDLGLGRDVDVMVSRSADDGVHWTSPKPLAEAFRSDRAEDRQPALATDGKGTWIVVWTSTQDLAGGSRRDRDIHLSVSTDNALTWSPPRALHSNASTDWGDDDSADITTDGKGRWVVVWQSADSLGNTVGGDRDILFVTSTDDGKSWTAPDVVDAAARGDEAFDTSPRVEAGGEDVWLVTWSSGNVSNDVGGLQRGVVVARSADGAVTWSPPQSLSGASEDDRPDFGPRLATNRRGEWICAWASSDDLDATIGKDRDLLYARSSDDGRTWTRRRALNREAADDSGDDDTPELAVDDAGNWVAVWTSWDKRDANRGADADLRTAMSRDGGRSWTRSYILNTNAEEDHGEDVTPSLATDGSGLWITAWASTESLDQVLSRDRDILIARGRFGREIAGPPEKNATR